MKKMILLTLISFTASNLYSAAAAPVLTKTDISAKIKKLQDKIKLLTGFEKDFADSPENVASFERDIALAQDQIKTLQAQLKTAPSK